MPQLDSHIGFRWYTALDEALACQKRRPLPSAYNQFAPWNSVGSTTHVWDGRPTPSYIIARDVPTSATGAKAFAVCTPDQIDGMLSWERQSLYVLLQEAPGGYRVSWPYFDFDKGTWTAEAVYDAVSSVGFHHVSVYESSPGRFHAHSSGPVTAWSKLSSIAKAIGADFGVYHVHRAFRLPGSCKASKGPDAAVKRFAYGHPLPAFYLMLVYMRPAETIPVELRIHDEMGRLNDERVACAQYAPQANPLKGSAKPTACQRWCPWHLRHHKNTSTVSWTLNDDKASYKVTCWKDGPHVMRKHIAFSACPDPTCPWKHANQRRSVDDDDEELLSSVE